jgi:TPR repeat protein
LLWEWQKWVRCGVPSDVAFREALVWRVEEWRKLDVRVGCVVCNLGFSMFRSAAEVGLEGMAVGEGEIGVVLELEGGSLRRLVRRGVRGYTCSASEGVLPPFALLRVGRVLAETRRTVVRLTAVAAAGHGLRGGGTGVVGVGMDEAERWFKEALSARGAREVARCIERAASLGHAEAMCRLAELHRKGEGIPMNQRAAVAWCRKAAERGHAVAMYNLGVAHKKGEGVREDARAAISWYRKAAERGHAVAMYPLGVMKDQGEGLPKEARAAISW